MQRQSRTGLFVLRYFRIYFEKKNGNEIGWRTIRKYRLKMYQISHFCPSWSDESRRRFRTIKKANRTISFIMRSNRFVGKCTKSIKVSLNACLSGCDNVNLMGEEFTRFMLSCHRSNSRLNSALRRQKR